LLKTFPKGKLKTQGALALISPKKETSHKQKLQKTGRERNMLKFIS
jgi:hypothetical protein